MTAFTSSLLDALDSSFLSSQPPLPNVAFKNRENTLNNYFPSQSSQDIDSLRFSGTTRIEDKPFKNLTSRVENSEDDSDISPHLSALLTNSPKKSYTGGFNLNYDNEAPILGIDKGGSDQGQKMADFVSHGIDNLTHGLTVARAREMLGLQDERDMIPGMEVRLLPHQAIGVAWMVSKEASSDRGGIMADDMGLGKTVQMIATMVKNPAGLDDDYKTTLIVVPAALLQQWKDEVEDKTNGMFTVHIHHGRDKLKKVYDILNYDVIITTYHTLMGDFQIPKDVDPSEEAEWLSNHGGVLAQVKFYRVVADEAQYIRNRATRASISLARIKARYRWMLTGTPVTNTLSDIYGLLRFGRFRPWNDWEAFRDYIAKVQTEDAPLAASRAQAILQSILLRRTKKSLIEGQPILQLPPKNIELVRVQFSEDEKDLYNSFEKRSKIRLNKFIRERTLVKNHAAVLVMILRLRQLCCHPNLILSQTEEYEDPTLLMAGDGEKELGRARKAMGGAWVNEVRQRFMARALATEVLDFSDEADVAEATCPVCQDLLLSDNGRVLMCGHEICFDCSMNMSQAPIEHDGIFGQGSEKDNIAAEKAYEEAAAKGYRPCPTCKKMVNLSTQKVFKFTAFEPTDEQLSKHAREARRAASRKRCSKWSGGKKSIERKRVVDDPSSDSDSSDELPDVGSMLKTPPAKRLKRVVESDEEVEDEDRLAGLTLGQVSVPLGGNEKKGVKGSDVEAVGVRSSLKKAKGKVQSQAKPGTKSGPNDGGPSQAVIDTWRRGDYDMEPSAKMASLLEMLQEWSTSGEKTIVYSQLSANRIVNLDLSWNYASESQAYDRVHRIGQEKEVFIKRLIVENTIEERMLRLQDVKVGLAEAALGEGSGTQLHKLSVKDIKYLFGMAPKKDGPTE